MLSFNRFLADLQIHGTPSQVVEQTVERVRSLNCAGVVNMLSMSGMPSDVAERNFRTYAEQVLPKLQGIDTFRQIGAAEVQARRAA